MNDIIVAGTIFGINRDFSIVRLHNVSKVKIYPLGKKIERVTRTDGTTEFKTEMGFRLTYNGAVSVEINELIKELQNKLERRKDNE